MDSLWRSYSYGPLRYLQASVSGHALVLPGGVLVCGGVPVRDFNWAFVYGPGDLTSITRTLVGRLRESGFPGHLLVPAELGDEVAAEAERLGLADQGEGEPLMLTGLTGTAPRARGSVDRPSGFAVRAIADEATFLAGIAVAGRAFGDDPATVRQVWTPMMLHLPGVHTFAAFVEGEPADQPVSYCSSVEVGEVVWLADVATDPDHQGRGAATALLGGVMDWWSKRGFTTFGLGSEPDAQHLYEKLGFGVAARSRVWHVEEQSPRLSP